MIFNQFLGASRIARCSVTKLANIDILAALCALQQAIGDARSRDHER
jgi:hypothetical protein